MELIHKRNCNSRFVNEADWLRSDKRNVKVNVFSSFFCLFVHTLVRFIVDCFNDISAPSSCKHKRK